MNSTSPKLSIHCNSTFHFLFLILFLFLFLQIRPSLIRDRVLEIEKMILKIQEADPSQENLEIEASLLLKLNEWLERDGLKWCKKSRALWLMEGDANSKFSHVSTLIRRHRNFISEIHLDSGHWIYCREEIEQYFSFHFQEVYNSSNLNIPPDLENLIHPCISAEDNLDLTRILDPREIQDAI